MEDLICREFDHTKELPQQRELFLDCFPENIGTKVIDEEHYVWKFRSFPDPVKKSYEYIACIGDEMVGYYAAVPYRYKIGEREVRAAMVCDVMTSSRHRGKGIFTKLGRYSTDSMAREGLPFSMGYPIRKEVIPGHLKVGWKIAFEMPLYIKFLSLRSFFKSRRAGILGYLSAPFVWAYNSLLRSSDDKNFTVEIHTRIEDIEGYDKFEQKWRRSVTNALIKDIGFCRWRYGAPDKEYIFFCAYKGEELAGVISARAIVKENVPSYGILDFMVTPGNEGAVGNLHNAVRNHARKNNKEALMIMSSRHSRRKYGLLGNGYLKSPFVFNLIIKNLTGEFRDEELYDESLWHLMFVDSDDL